MRLDPPLRFLCGILVGLAVLVLGAGCRGRTKEVETVSDAAEARIGVMTGSIGESIARNRFPNAKVQAFDDVMDAVTAIKSGQLEAVVMAFPTGFQIAKRNADLVVLEEPLDNEETAVALRKEDTALLAEVNRVITGLRKDGILEAMHRRWFKADLTPYEVPPIPSATNGAPLRIGVSATREPLTFVDDKGEVSGHDGELARRIGQAMGRPVEFSNMKFMALIPALQSGKVDLIVTGMNATEERRKSVAFSDPYFANAQVMLVRKVEGTHQKAMKAFPELENRPAAGGGALERFRKGRIGTLLGSAHSTWVSKNLPEATLLEFSSPSDISLAVKSGKVDVALSDSSPLRELMRQDPSFSLVGDPLFGYPVAAGVRKDSTELRTQFNAFLSGLRTQGIYDQMVERWVRKGDFTMPALPESGTNRVLKVGMTDGGMPFVGVQDGKLVGFEIELVRRFAASVGRRPEFSNMDFAALIPALVSGKVDLIVASIFVTDERRKQIDFTDPYHKETTQASALKGATATGSEAGTAAARPERKPFLERVRDSFQSNVLHERRYLLLWDGLKTTVIISLGAALFGTLLGAVVCWMRMARNALLSGVAKVYIALLRGTPVLVILMMIFYVVFASVDIHPVLVAMLAFGLNFAAYAAEIFRSGLEGIDRGQSEAGIAMGFTRFQTFRFILLPQTLQRILPVYKGECISLVKMTSIVGYIAVQDLTKASDIIRSRTFDAFFPLVMVAILYFLIAWVLLQLLGWVERRSGRRGRTRKEARA